VCKRWNRLGLVAFEYGGTQSAVFCWACASGFLSVVERLANHPDVEPLLIDGSALQHAIETVENYNVIEYLLRHPKVDPSIRKNEPIEKAVRFDHEKTVRLLLGDSRVRDSGGCEIALQTACEIGSVRIVSLLLKHPHVHPTSSALKVAIKGTHVEVIELLLEDGRVNVFSETLELLRMISTRERTMNNNACVKRILLRMRDCLEKPTRDSKRPCR
jgi:hypothetical protein